MRKRKTPTVSVKAVVLLYLFCIALSAEKLVFEDSAFPYRVVCEPGWAETLKNDSVLVLDNTASGKKICFELQRSTIDESYDSEIMEWSRLNFVISKEMAYTFGRLVFFDTTSAKRLGGYHAFELFSFFSDSSGTVWWAEYDRWTEYDRNGFLVSIIGDTIDMKENLSHYTEMVDSIRIQANTSLLWYNTSIHGGSTLRMHSVVPLRWHDLLGREVAVYRNRLMVGKKARRCPVR